MIIKLTMGLSAFWNIGVPITVQNPVCHNIVSLCLYLFVSPSLKGKAKAGQQGLAQEQNGGMPPLLFFFSLFI